MSYSKWAESLARHFFGPQFARERVRLMVSEEMLEECMPELGGKAGFIDALELGPEWCVDYEQRTASLRQRGSDVYDHWSRAAGGNPVIGYPDMPYQVPAYLPFLCLLSLAWSEDLEDTGAANFYGRLRALYPHSDFENDINHNLAYWEPLWEGLEQWSQNKNGNFGVFRVEVLGMAHVGKPKSQVIFTPNKVERLPELFWRLRLSPGTNADQILAAINQRPTYANAILHGRLVDEIARRSALGEATLERLQDYLDGWDGRMPECLANRGGGGGAEVGGGGVAGGAAGTIAAAVQHSRLRLVLAPINDNTQWVSRFGLSDSEDSSSMKMDEGWVFRVSGSRLSILYHNDQPVDACAEGRHNWWSRGRVLSGHTEDDAGGLSPVKIHLGDINDPQNNCLRVLEVMDNQLVEVDDVPAAGGGFFLVHQNIQQNWDAWRQAGQLDDRRGRLPQMGLPENWALGYLGNLENLTDEMRQTMPGPLADRPRPSIASLRGGSRVWTGTSKGTYLSYDLPKLEIRSKDFIAVDIHGGCLYEETSKAESFMGELPDTGSHLYKIEADKGAKHISIKISGRAGNILWAQRILLASSDVEAIVAGGNFKLDGLARPVRDPSVEGVRGVCVPSSHHEPWNFEWGLDGLSALMNYRIPTGWQQDSALLLQEAFAVHVSGRANRIPYPAVKKIARNVAGIDGNMLQRTIRWMCNLGHIEIEADHRGRWAHIWPNKLVFYVLPSKGRDGTLRYVLAGCSTRARLCEIVERSQAMGCTVRIDRQNHLSSCLPPRIMLASNSRECVEQVAETQGLQSLHTPPSWSLTSFSTNLDGWANGLSYFTGPGPDAEKGYSPVNMTQNQEALNEPGRFTMRMHKDRQTGKHETCFIVDRGDPNDGGYRHAYIKDHSWGRWQVHRSHNDALLAALPGIPPAPTGVPYEQTSGTLAVPAVLILPYLLARSLYTCSGLAPNTAHDIDAYNARRGTNVFPAAPYSGRVNLYENVPRIIAERVLEKIGLCPVNEELGRMVSPVN